MIESPICVVPKSRVWTIFRSHNSIKTMRPAACAVIDFVSPMLRLLTDAILPQNMWLPVILNIGRKIGNALLTIPT